MALLNNRYIWVESESVDRSIETSDHPVEKGVQLTDNVKRTPITLSLKGAIVGKNAKKTLDYLVSCMNKGKPVKYSGVNKFTRTMIIESINTDNTYKIMGGYSVDIKIREIRIAQNNYKKKTKSKTNSKTKNGTKQVKQNKKGAVYHVVKKGENASTIAKKYKSLGCTLSFIIKNNNNTKVLSKKGDWKTMRIGAKVLVGYRK